MAEHLYWRLTATNPQNTAATNCTIAEIEMRGTVGGPDLCTGGIVTADSFLIGFPTEPTYAVDDSPSTQWSSASSGYPHWIQYQFSIPVNIAEYVIQASSLGDWDSIGKIFTLSWSDDNINFTVVDTVGTLTWTGANEIKTFQVPPVIEVPASAIDIAFLPPNFIWDAPQLARYFYTLTLTGAADATTDLDLPISSWQSRLRNEQPSYLSAVVPSAERYIDKINLRPNGDIAINRGVEGMDGSINYSEIARVLLETITTDEGGRSRSATLTGHRTSGMASPKSVTINGVNYRNLSGGKRRFRTAEIDLFLRPGDTAIIGAESIVVGYISYAVSANFSQMHIEEA